MAKRKLLTKSTLLEAYKHIYTAKSLTDLYEQEMKFVSKYVHATSRGHEAIQVSIGMQLRPQDYAYPYYRDDAMLLGMGILPYQLMLQLMAKKDDVFSGGRTYYCHPSLNHPDFPKIPHQSSATGMQAIPAAGAAMGLKYRRLHDYWENDDQKEALVVCSLGDASATEGEVSEALQMASLWQLPILFLVQDNEWDISAKAEEIRSQNACEYADGFKGLEAWTIDGSDFTESYETVHRAFDLIRKEKRPLLLHARVPLLNHHTSGVRKEWYRDDLEEDRLDDPLIRLRNQLASEGVSDKKIKKVEAEVATLVYAAFEEAKSAPYPDPETLHDHIFQSFDIVESGERLPSETDQETVMVDTALHAIEEIMSEDIRCLFYGQDVGGRLGGVFREAATLAQKFGDNRVFNTAIQEAFIVGSTVGLSAVGLKPIVEVQFADYIWPGLNQLFTEVSRSSYLSNGQWPVSMILRVPTGAYGSGGPFHSSSVESVLTKIQGIKIAYPSNGADLKGLLKAAYQDPNPVVMLEHKGLYWSKVKGTEAAKCIEPADDYVLPFGVGCIVQEANADRIEQGDSMVIITYGMGVHWALNASKRFEGNVEIVDLRTLYPLDEELVFDRVKLHSKCLVLTEESSRHSFAESLVGRIQTECFECLDASVRLLGSANVPAIPLNADLEQAFLPSLEQVQEAITDLLEY